MKYPYKAALNIFDIAVNLPLFEKPHIEGKDGWIIECQD